jgi:heterodisulfide reductase subunit B
MKFVYFPGCVIPQKENSYEMSARKICEKLDIELVDMEGANCCGLNLDPVDHFSSVLLAARDLCLAEEMGSDILVLCNGCFGHLSRVKNEILRDEILRKRVNKALKSINKIFHGTVKVKHIVQTLINDVGTEKIGETIVRPLNKLKVAPYYGCHIVKPSDELTFDNPETTQLLDSLIDVTGAKRINYRGKNVCCGAPIMGINEKISLMIARDKLRNIQKAGSNTIVTICPFCHLQFDLNQLTIEDEYSEEYGIQVLHYPQLLGLAQGINPEDLGLYENRIPVDEILEALEIS